MGFEEIAVRKSTDYQQAGMEAECDIWKQDGV